MTHTVATRKLISNPSIMINPNIDDVSSLKATVMNEHDTMTMM